MEIALELLHLHCTLKRLGDGPFQQPAILPSKSRDRPRTGRRCREPHLERFITIIQFDYFFGLADSHCVSVRHNYEEQSQLEIRVRPEERHQLWIVPIQPVDILRNASEKARSVQPL